MTARRIAGSGAERVCPRSARDDSDGDRRRDAVRELCDARMIAGGFDRLSELELVPVESDAELGSYGIGDLRGRHGAEELALLAALRAHGDGFCRKRRSERLRFGERLVVALLLRGAAAFELREVACGRFFGQPLR